MAAQIEELFFGHGGDFVPHNKDAAAIGPDKPEHQLEDGALARAGNAQQHLGFASHQFEGDGIEDGTAFKGDRYLLKDDGFVALVGRRRREYAGAGIDCHV